MYSKKSRRGGDEDENTKRRHTRVVAKIELAGSLSWSSQLTFFSSLLSLKRSPSPSFTRESGKERRGLPIQDSSYSILIIGRTLTNPREVRTRSSAPDEWGLRIARYKMHISFCKRYFFANQYRGF